MGTRETPWREEERGRTEQEGETHKEEENSRVWIGYCSTSSVSESKRRAERGDSVSLRAVVFRAGSRDPQGSLRGFQGNIFK